MHHALPTWQQLAWQQAELSMFLHFGMNTFTDREWGDGTEDPSLFNPERLDTRQWLSVARDAGFRYAILTAKHHDGFCLWQSSYTDHSVKNSPWKGGTGDVVRDFVEACGETGVHAGLYLSPWDRHERTYGDSYAYNQHFVNQLTELLTNYGRIAEVWFDGACGEGPNGKRQVYDWQRYYETVRRCQPEALIAICGPDIRWVGNEDGFAAETEWSARAPDPAVHAGQEDEIWWPAECDVSIRPGWFWHPAEDARVKSLDTLVDIYYRSVGRNSVLLLNVPPNREGLVAAPDVARLKEFRGHLDRAFAEDLAQTAQVSAPHGVAGVSGHDPERLIDGDAGTWWEPEGGMLPAVLDVTFPMVVRCDSVVLQEHIALGQSVERYRVEFRGVDGWEAFSAGTTIGQKKIDRRGAVDCTALRLVVESARGPVRLQRAGIYDTSGDA